MRGFGFAIAGFQFGMVFEAWLARHAQATTPRDSVVKIVLALLVLLILSATREREIGLE